MQVLIAAAGVVVLVLRFARHDWEMWFMLMSPCASCLGSSSVSVSAQEVSVEVEGEGAVSAY